MGKVNIVLKLNRIQSESVYSLKYFCICKDVIKVIILLLYSTKLDLCATILADCVDRSDRICICLNTQIHGHATSRKEC